MSAPKEVIVILTFQFYIFFCIFCSDVNECDMFKPCQNNGTCINSNGSYNCDCTEGWKGKDCDKGNLQNNFFAMNNVVLKSLYCIQKA